MSSADQDGMDERPEEGEANENNKNNNVEEDDDDDDDSEDELDDDNLPTRRAAAGGGGGGGGDEEEDDEDDDEEEGESEEGEEDEEKDTFAQLPDATKGLRACKKCRLIKEFQQFVEYGCDNCRQFEDQEEAAEFTSPHFTGMMALVQPHESWSAKWQGATHFKPGLYALQVEGEDELVEEEVE